MDRYAGEWENEPQDRWPVDDEDETYIQEDGDNSPEMIADRRRDDLAARPPTVTDRHSNDGETFRGHVFIDGMLWPGPASHAYELYGRYVAAGILIANPLL